MTRASTASDSASSTAVRPRWSRSPSVAGLAATAASTASTSGSSPSAAAAAPPPPSAAAAAVRGYERVEDDASDHFPVVVDLALPSAPAPAVLAKAAQGGSGACEEAVLFASCKLALARKGARASVRACTHA